VAVLSEPGGKTKAHALPKQRLLTFYLQMLETRAFEEQVDAFFAKGMIHGTTHLCIGQEGCGVAAVNAADPADYIMGTHRSHGHCIAKGSDIGRMMAELMGRETGYSHGKGGSMHIADLDEHFLGANGIVGGGLPIADGAALALKMQGRSEVVLCFFGDGSTNEGSFHESLNLAAIWKLPVVFICENNQYGMSGSVKRMAGNPDIAARAVGYGIPGKTVDGNDVLAVYDAVSEAIERARSGEGPSLLVHETYRQKGHSKSDANRYRTREEIDAWRKRDPIPRFRQYLLESAGATEAELAQVEQQAKDAIAEAVRFAEASPNPDISTLLTDVYAE